MEQVPGCHACTLGGGHGSTRLGEGRSSAAAIPTLGNAPGDRARCVVPGLDAENHVFAYFREITGAPADGSAADFIDTGRDKEDLDALKAEIAGNPGKEIPGRLPDDHVYRYESPWRGDKPESDLDALCERVRQDLQRIIDAELKALSTEARVGSGKGAHREFAESEVGISSVAKMSCSGSRTIYRRSSGQSPAGDSRCLRLWKDGTDGAGLAHALRLETAAARFMLNRRAGTADLRTLLRSLM